VLQSSSAVVANAEQMTAEQDVAAVMLNAGSVKASGDVRATFMMAGDVSAEGDVRVTFDPPAAFALGAGIAAVLLVVRTLLRKVF
jgi:hypothetical protein